MVEGECFVFLSKRSVPYVFPVISLETLATFPLKILSRDQTTVSSLSPFNIVWGFLVSFEQWLDSEQKGTDHQEGFLPGQKVKDGGALNAGLCGSCLLQPSIKIEHSCQWIKILPSSGFDNMYETSSPLYISTNVSQRLPHSAEILPGLRYGENPQAQGLCYNTRLHTEEVPSRLSLVLFS